jgi:chromosome transmission fidelity protein 4
MHSVRYAHAEGHTDVCFTQSGRLLTTGEDGDIRIWQNFDDVDTSSIQVGDKCFAIAHHCGKIYVGDDLNEVKCYEMNENGDSGECKGVVTSFTLPVTCIAVNKSGTFLVCGAADFDIHLVNLSTLKFQSLTGHDAPILSVCFDPLEKYFISSSCDGSARVWSVQNLNTVKTLSNLQPKSNDFNDSISLCKVAWHKDGGLIGVPCYKEIHFYERETWLLKFKIALQIDGADAANDNCIASILAFSPCGKYVLATTSTQMIYIHDIINKSLIFKYSYKKTAKMCSLAWNPKDTNEIIFCDTKGYMGSVKYTIIKTTEVKSSKKQQLDNMEMDDLLNLIDADETSNHSSTTDSKSSKKNEMKSPKKKRKRLSDNKDDENNSDEGAIEENMDSEMSNGNNVDDDDDDDDGDENDLESLEKLKKRTLKTVRKEVLMMEQTEANNNDDMDGNYLNY